VSGSGISGAVCKSASRSRQITIPAPHHSVFYRPDALPAAQPTASKHWRQLVALVIQQLSRFQLATDCHLGCLATALSLLSVTELHGMLQFLPCNTMLARYCVCHKSVLCRNCWTNRAASWHGSFLRPILHYVVRYFQYSKNKGTKLWTCARASWSFYQQTHQQLTLLTTPAMVDARHCTQFVTRRLTVML